MRRKLLTLLVSSCLAGLLGWAVFRALAPGPGEVRTVEFVDQVDEFERLLRSRERAGPEAGGGEEEDRLLASETDRAAILPLIQPRGERYVLDPIVYYKLAPHLDYERKFREHPAGRYRVQTNAKGLRNAADIRAERPDVRVLVAGDSHTRGLCSNDETFAALLEDGLRRARPGETVEVLNAGVDSHHHYMYVGDLERYGPELAPHVFVAVVFGGNDFAGALKFQRYFRRRPMYARGAAHAVELDHGRLAGLRWLDQEIQQIRYFLDNPSELAEIEALDDAAANEIARLAREHGAQPLIVYLPPPSRGQPARYGPDMAKLARAFGVAPRELAFTDRIADAWMRSLAASGIPHVDLRPAFRAREEPLYWKDGHINLAGHRAVAEALLPQIQALLAR